MTIEKRKRKNHHIDQIPAELTKAGVGALRSVIHKLINSL